AAMRIGDAVVGTTLRNGDDDQARSRGRVLVRDHAGFREAPAELQPGGTADEDDLDPARVARRIRALIEHAWTTEAGEGARLGRLRDDLIHAGVDARAVARELGQDPRALRHGGGSYLRGLLAWVARERLAYLERTAARPKEPRRQGKPHEL